MGPKLLNCCRPEKMGTQEFGKMLERIETLEEGRVPATDAKHGDLREREEKNYKKGVPEDFKQI